MSRHLVYPLLAMLIAPSLQAGNFYKSVDDKGVVTYGNSPPASKVTQASGQGTFVGAIESADGRRHEIRKQSNQQLQAFLQQDIAKLLRNHNQQRPVPAGPNLQGYRYARPWKSDQYAVSQGFNGSFSHNTPQSRYAMDIAMPEGTPLYAARGGTVIKAMDSQLARSSANGNYLRIQHADGTTSAYLHLQSGSLGVRAGQRVSKGEYLANSGNTGRSTGPHLHFVVQQRVYERFESIPFEFDTPIPQLPNFAASGD